MKSTLQFATLLSLLYHAVQSQVTTHYCPENRQTVTVPLTGTVQLRGVFDGSDTYRRNQKCSWIIQAGPEADKRIHVSVVLSNLQWTPSEADCSKYDYVSIRDGDSRSAPVLSEWCGGRTPYTVISKQNKIYVEFVSDDIHLSENKGVTLEVSDFSVSPTTGNCPPGFETDTGEFCYGVKTHVETWKDAQDYCATDQANLVTINTAEQQEFVIEKAKEALLPLGLPGSVWIGLNDIISEGDYMWVDGTQTETAYSVSMEPAFPEKYKDCMVLDISSGGWVEDHCHRPEAQSLSKHAFVCQRRKDGTTVPKESPPVETITYNCEANGKLLLISSAETARIETRLSGKKYYDNNLECIWLITSGLDPNKRIHLTVGKPDLQWTPSDAICYGFDYLEIRDGGNSTSPVLNTFCGTMHSRTMISKTNQLYITFVSNDRNLKQRRGVSIDFTFFSVAPSHKECPPGWIADTKGKYCYNIRTDKAKWVDAQAACNLDRANLVSFEDAGEEKLVLDYAVQTLIPLGESKVWIGMSDIAQEGKFDWIDGVQGSVKPSWWKTPFTSKVYLDCVLIQLADRSWKEDFCTDAEVQTVTEYPFICKRNIDDSTILYAIPAKQEERPKGRLPPKGLIIALVVLAILVVIAIAVGVYVYIRKKRGSQAAAKTQQEEQPPSYNEVMMAR